MRSRTILLTTLLAVTIMGGCDHDEPERAGRPCATADDCYPDVDPEALSGPIECLDRVPTGYCTHQCVTDEDCCAVEGECETGLPQVCAPFESTGLMLCFLSCEDDLVGDVDPTAYCQRWADPAFGCRSTGGGALNRKVCVP